MVAAIVIYTNAHIFTEIMNWYTITDILEHFFVVGIAASVVLGLFLAVVFFRQKKKNKQTNTILALLLISFCLSILLHSFLNAFIPRAYPNIWTFPEPFLLLTGPLFYTYIRFLSGLSLSKKEVVVHLIPFFTTAVIFIIFVSNNEQSFPVNVNLGNASSLLWLIIYLQFWVYYFLNRNAINHFKERLKESYSSIEKIHQVWISFCLTALLICYTILTVVFLLGHGNIFLPVNESLTVVLAAIIYFMSYQTLVQPAIYTGTLLTEGKSSDIAKTARYKNSGLSGGITKARLEDIEQFIADHKPYLDPDLDLQGLGELLAISTHHLSQIINEGAQMNFYDFVNRYRIEEAKRLLSDPKNDHLTILSLAFDAGFNSKATFNRFFKKITQLTPSQYREKR